MLKDFMEEKAKREGKITPKLLIEELLKVSGDISDVVIVFRRESDHEVTVGLTCEDPLIALGLLEAGKALYIEELAGDV